jgi:hypothetical protein
MWLIALKRPPGATNLPHRRARRRRVDDGWDDGFDLKPGLRRPHNMAGGSGQPSPAALKRPGPFWGVFGSAWVRPPPRHLDLPLLYGHHGHRSNSAERQRRVPGDARHQDAWMGRFRRLPPSRRLARGRVSEPLRHYHYRDLLRR